MDVIYFIQGEDTEIHGRVATATDFLQALRLVDVVTLDQQEYKLIETGLIVGEGEPCISVLLEAY